MHEVARVISSLTESSSREETLDYIFDTFDDLLLAGRFSEVDLILDDIEVDTVPDVFLIGVLTITRPAKVLGDINAWDDFRARVAEKISNPGDLDVLD